MKYIISLVFFTISIFGFDYHLKPYKISEDVECFFGLSSTANEINGGNIINSCYIKTEEGYLVIDSGPSYSYAQQANSVINNYTERLPVKYVINTTAEEAHILGNNFYKEQGARLLGPREYKKYEYQKKLYLKKTIGRDSFQNTRIVALDEYVGSTKTIYLGELEIKIIKIIRESDRYLIVYLPQKNIIFVGDMIFNNRIPSLKSGRSLIRWLEALQKIEQIPWSRMVSAHGIHTRNSAMEKSKNYLTILKNRVTEKIENGESKESIVENTKMFSFVDENFYDKCHKSNLSFAYDELIKKISVVKDREEDSIAQSDTSKVFIVNSIKKHFEPDIKYYGFTEAMRKAIKSKKIVLFKIWSDNCPFCKELDAVLKKNNQVKRLINQNFVMVSLNNSRDELPLNIRLKLTPSLVFIRPDTQEVKMIIPGIEALGELVDILKEGIIDGKRDGYLK